MKSKHSKNIATLRINGKEYDVYLAKSEKQKIRGLQGFEDLPEDEGMLFINKEPENVWYHMQNVEVPLDLVFMDDDMKVISVKHGKPNDPSRIEESNVTYVLEVKSGSGIKEGDEADLDDEDTNYVMKMLAPDGSVQFKLQGGERIFSRISTKNMIRKALKAELSKEDKDYKALGKYVLKELYKQDHREPQYVEGPKNG